MFNAPKPEDDEIAAASAEQQVNDKPLPTEHILHPSDRVASSVLDAGGLLDSRPMADSESLADSRQSGTNDALYCPECYLPLHPDPAPEKLFIFLHALRYTSASLGAFETPLPEWAAPGYVWED